MSAEPAGDSRSWERLAEDLRAAVREAEAAVADAPLAGAVSVVQRLAAIVGCLTAAEETWRSGVRDGAGAFREELANWRERWPVMKAWVGATAAMVDGWGEVAGVGVAYGPPGCGRQDGHGPRLTRAG